MAHYTIFGVVRKSQNMKLCTKCGSRGPFAKDKRLRSGLSSRCRVCLAESRKAWVESNKVTQLYSPETKKICTKCNGPGPFYKDSSHKSGLMSHCKKCVNSGVTARRQKHSVAHSYKRRAKRYGLTTEELDSLWSKQQGLCGICNNSLKLGKKTHVDHNHVTGQVRGLLCENCNRGLGLFKELEQNLLNAVAWLRGQ